MIKSDANLSFIDTGGGIFPPKIEGEDRPVSLSYKLPPVTLPGPEMLDVSEEVVEELHALNVRSAPNNECRNKDQVVISDPSCEKYDLNNLPKPNLKPKLVCCKLENCCWAGPQHEMKEHLRSHKVVKEKKTFPMQIKTLPAALKEVVVEAIKPDFSDEDDLKSFLSNVNFLRYAKYADESCCLDLGLSKRRFEISLRISNASAFQDCSKDSRQDNLCGGADLKHKNALYVEFEYTKKLMVKTPFYRVRKFFQPDLVKWEEQLNDKGLSYVNEKLKISYELLRQIKSALVINPSMDVKTVWERLNNAAKNVSSINLDKDVCALTPVVTHTCFAAYELFRQESFQMRNLDFPSAPTIESSVTGHELPIDSISHRSNRLKKMCNLGCTAGWRHMRAALSLFQQAAMCMGRVVLGWIRTTSKQLSLAHQNALGANLPNHACGNCGTYDSLLEDGFEETWFLWPQIPTSQLTPGLIVLDTLVGVRRKLRKLMKRFPMMGPLVVAVSSVLLSLLLSANLTVALSTLVVSTLAMISLKLLLVLYLN
jgi:hypothetical protein